MRRFIASLYYKEQKQTLSDKVCGNCNESGHIRRECPNEVVCCDQVTREEAHSARVLTWWTLTQWMLIIISNMTVRKMMIKVGKKVVLVEEGSGEDEVKEPGNSGKKVTEDEDGNEVNENDEVQKKKTTKQMTISAIWSNVAGATPKTTSSGRTASPVRVRRAEDRSLSNNDK